MQIREILQKRYWFSFSFIIVAILFGGFLRWYSLSKTDFPLNDGGLFYTMTTDLVQNHFRLPEFTSYNQANIPFAYPPLGFYLAGFISTFFHLSLIEVFRFLPVTLNLFSLVIFFFIARRILLKTHLAGIATIIYAMMPSAFRWVIMGGGISRAPGMFFQFLTILFFFRFLENKKNWDAAYTSIFLSFTLMSHLEMFWETCIGLFVIFIFSKPEKLTYIISVLIGLGTLTLSSPYWAAVISRHGLAVYQNAFFSGGFNIFDSIAKIFLFNFTDEFITPIIGILALLGLFYCLQHHNFYLPVWLLLIILLNPRSMDRSASKIIVMLAVISVETFLVPVLKGIAATENGTSISFRKSGWLWVGIIILQVFMLSFFRSIADNNVLESVNKPARNAMNWVVENTPPQTRFLIIDDSESWETDKIAEWFPQITKRISVATIQGTEWLIPKDYWNWDQIYDDMKECTWKDTVCLENWSSQNNISYDYIFVSDDPCNRQDTYCISALAASLRLDPQYKNGYRQDNIEIYKVND